MINVVRKSLSKLIALGALLVVLAGGFQLVNAMTVDDSPLPFGNVNIGQSKTLTFRVENNYTLAGQYRVSGGGSYFNCTNNCGPVTNNPGQGRNVSITFTPNDPSDPARDYTNTITIEENFGNGWVEKAKIKVTGKGVINPVISPSNALIFDDTRTYGPFSAGINYKSVTITNPTNGTLRDVYLTTGGDFSCSGAGCSAGNKVDIAPYGSLTKTIAFNPSQYGYRDRNLNIYASNAFDNSQSLVVAGYGVCDFKCLVVLSNPVNNLATVWNFSLGRLTVNEDDWFIEDRGEALPDARFECDSNHICYDGPIPFGESGSVKAAGWITDPLYCTPGELFSSTMDVRFGLTITDFFPVSVRCPSSGIPPTPPEGACGTAHINAEKLDNQPTGGSACAVGTANWSTSIGGDPVGGDGSYNWRCDASGGSSGMCTATRKSNVTITPVSYTYPNTTLGDSSVRQFSVQNVGGGTQIAMVAPNGGADDSFFKCEDATACDFNLLNLKSLDDGGTPYTFDISFNPTTAGGERNYNAEFAVGALTGFGFGVFDTTSLSGYGAATPVPQPDLVSNGSNPAPGSSVTAGEVVNFQIDVLNDSFVDAGPFVDKFSISTNGTTFTDLSPTVSQPAGLLQTQTVTDIKDITIPDDGSTQMWVQHCVDSNDNVTESDEDNCVEYGPYSIDVTEPDLVSQNVTCVSASCSGFDVVYGQDVTIAGSVYNQGDGEADGTFYNSIYYSIQPAGDTPNPNILVTNTNGITDLSSGGLVTRQFTLPTASALPGQLIHVRHCVDNPADNIDESNEGNNCSGIITFNASFLDPEVRVTTSPERFARVGDEVDITWSVKNLSGQLNCDFLGPNLNKTSHSFTSNNETESDTVNIESTSVYTIRCSYDLDTMIPPTTYEDSTIVEIIPDYEEI